MCLRKCGLPERVCATCSEPFEVRGFSQYGEAMNQTLIKCAAVFALLPGVLTAKVPHPVAELTKEMRETGATCQGGVAKDLGIFIVGIGHARYKENDIAYSREIAEINAKKRVSSVLAQSFRAKDVVGLELTADSEGRKEVKAFVSAHSKAEIDQLMKGWQIVSSGKNAAGQMEVVGFITAQMADRADDLVKAQLEWGDQGVVAAVGIDADRAFAEKNALRSAVEQVAGTLVVGKVSVNEKEELHKRLATTAGALVEEYRITKETKAEAEFKVEILARVSKKKLYDNYRSYFKSLDDPMFCLVATDPSLIRHFNQFFTDKGLHLTGNQEEAQYFIKLDGRFRDRPTPGNDKSEGTMLDLSISVEAVDSSRTLLTMNEKQSKDSEILNSEQRREEVSRRIFRKLESRLHKALHELVIRMLDDADDKGIINAVPTATTF